jgi:hypothetical protein
VADLVALAAFAPRDPDALWPLLMIAALMLVVLALFHSLTVEVVRGELRLRFGVGLIRRRFAIADVHDTRIHRTRWWYGWGIRLTPHGWLFSVSGFDAVGIELKDGKKYLIGSDEPKKLLAAITTAMARHG